MDKAELIARKKELEAQIAELEAQQRKKQDAQALRIADNDYLMKGDRSGIDAYRQNQALEASVAASNGAAATAGNSALEDARMNAKFDLESAKEKYAVALAAVKQSSTPSTRAEAAAALVDVQRARYAAQKLGVDTKGSAPVADVDGGESVQSLISQATALKSRADNKKYVSADEIGKLKTKLDEMGDAEGAAAASAILQGLLDKELTVEGENKRMKNSAALKAKAKAKHREDLNNFVQKYKDASRIGEDLSPYRTNPLYDEALKLGLIDSAEKAGR